MAQGNYNAFYILAAAISFLVYKPSYCQIVGSEPCPIAGGAVFDDPTDLSGVWYEDRKYASDSDNITSCTRFTFSDPDPATRKRQLTIDANKRPIPNKQNLSTKEFTLILSREGRRITVHATMTPINERFSKYLVDYPDTDLLSTTYNVLGYSPKSWMLVWVCSTYDYFHVQQAHILTRNRNPPKEVIEEALLVAKKNEIPRWLFRRTYQLLCSDD